MTPYNKTTLMQDLAEAYNGSHCVYLDTLHGTTMSPWDEHLSQ